MNHTDTPETDKWTGLRHNVRQLAETSRRLERERNAAIQRLAVERLKYANDESHLVRAEAQRDMLIEALDGINVACFRIGRGDIGDIGFAIQTIRQKARDAILKIRPDHETKIPQG